MFYYHVTKYIDKNFFFQVSVTNLISPSTSNKGNTFI